MLLCKFVHLTGLDLHKTCHLVGKGSRTTRTRSVHSNLKIALEEKDLRILSTKLDNHVGIGQTVADGHLSGIDLLHKGDTCSVGKSHSGRARYCTYYRLGYIKFIYKSCYDLSGLFGYHGEMSLIALMEKNAIIVKNHAFNSSRTYINTNSHYISFPYRIFFI